MGGEKKGVKRSSWQKGGPATGGKGELQEGGAGLGEKTPGEVL